MAMKIEFSASFKDAESTLKILQELNKETLNIARHSTEAGADGRRAFEELGRAIASFETSSKSVAGLKEMNSQIKELTSAKNEIGLFSRVFSDLGKSMQTGLGFASEMMLTNFKKATAELKTEADATAKKLKEALSMMNDADATQEQRDVAKLRAGAFATQYAQQKQNIDVAEKTITADTPRAWLGGGTLGGAASFLKGAAGPVAATTFAVSELYKISRQDIEAGIINRGMAYSSMDMAREGRVTNLLMQSGKLGEEQNYGGVEKMFDRYGKNLGVLGATLAGALTGTAVGGPLGTLVGAYTAYQATGGWKDADLRENEKRQALRELDMKQFGRIIDPGWSRMQGMYESNRQLFFSQGQETITDNMIRLNEAGIRKERAFPIMDMLDRYGRGLSGTNIYRAQQDMGLSGEAMQELVRQNQVGDSNIDSLSLALGSSGLTNRRAMSSLADVYSSFSGRSAGGFAEMDNIRGGINAGVQAIIQGSGGKVTDLEATQKAGEMAGKISFTNARSLLGASMNQKLIQMGVTSPIARDALLKEMDARNFTGASGIISKLTGKDATEVLGEIQGTQRRVAGTLESTLGVTDEEKAAFKEFNRDASGYVFGKDASYGQAQAGKAFFDMISGKQGDISTKAMQKKQTEMEGAEEIFAKQEGLELKTMDTTIKEVVSKLGLSVTKTLALGFENMSNKLTQESQNFTKDLRKEKAVTGPRGSARQYAQ